jgi:uncharacterized protein (DUF427 family)
VILGGEVVADAPWSWCVLETSHPPGYYLDPAFVRTDLLSPTGRRSGCEWKGTAEYLTVRAGDALAENAAWRYPDPTPAFAPMAGCIAFYPAAMDRCLVDGEAVRAQEGGFYGGWITSDLAGPFKGGPGSWGW